MKTFKADSMKLTNYLLAKDSSLLFWTTNNDKRFYSIKYHHDLPSSVIIATENMKTLKEDSNKLINILFITNTLAYFTRPLMMTDKGL